MKLGRYIYVFQQIKHKEVKYKVSFLESRKTILKKEKSISFNLLGRLSSV